MNTHPIETALDPDLRLSVQAMARAAQRARDIARQTDTALVVSHNGVIELLQPDRISESPSALPEPSAPTKDQ